MEVLCADEGPISIEHVPSILEKMRERLNADTAHFELEFPYFMEKLAPVTGKRGVMGYTCAFEACSGGHEDFVIRVEVPVTTLCPCSKEIAEYGAHNQRGLVKLSVRFKEETIWLEELIELIEDSGSCALYPVLKRPDEKWVTEKAYDNPRFVEDLSREVVVRLRKDKRVRWFSVEVENFESIPAHNSLCLDRTVARRGRRARAEPPSTAGVFALALLVAVLATVGCGEDTPIPDLDTEGLQIVVVDLSEALKDAAQTDRFLVSDEVASQLIVFDQAYAQSADPEIAKSSLLTGLYPRTVKDTPEAPTLPMLLGHSGTFNQKADVAATTAEHEGETAFVYSRPDRPSALKDPFEALGAVTLDESIVVFIAGRSQGNATVMAQAGLDATVETEEIEEIEEQALPTTLAPAALHVPLAIRLPGGAHAQRISHLVETIDLVPTLLDLAGHEIPSVLPGKSLVPMIVGESRPRYFAFSETPGVGTTVALAGVQLAHYEEWDKGRLSPLDPPRFFLTQDEGLFTGSFDQASGERYFEVLDHHRKAWLARLDQGVLGSDETLDAETLEQLKDLGYL